MRIKTSTQALATASLALLLALTACHKDENPTTGTPVPLCATASLPGAEGDATVSRAATGDARGTVGIQFVDDATAPVHVSLSHTPSGGSTKTYEYTLANANGTQLVLDAPAASQAIVTPGESAHLTIAPVSLPLQTVATRAANATRADATVPSVPFRACVEYNPGASGSGTTTLIGAGGTAHLPLAYTTCALRLVLHLQQDAGGKSVPVTSATCYLPMTTIPGDAPDVTRTPTTHTGATRQTVIFGQLSPSQSLTTALAGRPLAVLTTAGGSALSVNLPPTSGITATPQAGQMLTLNVHVSRTVASIQSITISEFSKGNGDTGEDATVGSTLVLNGLEATDDLWELCAAGKYTDWIVTGGSKEIFTTDQSDPNNGKTKDQVVLENVRKALNAYTDGGGAKGTINLTLPEVVEMPTHDGSNGAFQGYSALSSISAPEATDIGSTAFYNCNALTSISLPKATDIGTAAFGYCIALTRIEIPSVTTVSYTGGLRTNAFSNFANSANCTLVLNPLLDGGTDTSSPNLAAFDSATGTWTFLNESWPSIQFTHPTNP